MVEGLDKFVDHFAGMEDCFVLIGGAACDVWMGDNDLEFRTTKDLDLVLVVEALGPEFFERFWSFVKAGKYESLQQSDERPEFYRFIKPSVAGYPFMIELLCQNSLNLAEGIHLTPIPADEDISSLSAILLNDDYYAYVMDTKLSIGGVPIAPACCLIPLKARAYLDLMKRKEAGDQRVRGSDIKKHRYDVFRLYRTMPPSDRHQLPDLLRDDLTRFLASIPADSEEWDSVMAAVGRSSLPGPSEILLQIREIFEL